MSRIEQVFGVPRVLLPVVHPVTWDRALESVQVAHEVGVKGVFLIDQGLTERKVLELVLAVRARFPQLWVGVNLLTRGPAAALEAALDGCEGRIDGIWNDNARIDEHVEQQHGVAAEMTACRERHAWTGLYFGGVAFKYQRDVAAVDLGRATARGAKYMDVVCTSGPGTGQAANVEKLEAMRRGAGPEVAIALASGVTSENVGSYLPYVNAYLVGTGIEESFGVLDRAKVAALHAAIDGERGVLGRA